MTPKVLIIYCSECGEFVKLYHPDFLIRLNFENDQWEFIGICPECNTSVNTTRPANF